jgi:hypothetical protein
LAGQLLVFLKLLATWNYVITSLGFGLRAGVQRARGREEAAIKRALSLLPGPGVFLEADRFASLLQSSST